jgi:hypothetical protein
MSDYIADKAYRKLMSVHNKDKDKEVEKLLNQIQNDMNTDSLNAPTELDYIWEGRTNTTQYFTNTDSPNYFNTTDNPSYFRTAPYKDDYNPNPTSSVIHEQSSNDTKIDYKYNEDKFLEEMAKFIDSTYSSHYSGSIQPVEFIMSNSTTLDYLKGNAVKYLYRYGKKDGNNIKDLFKACHFIMMMAKYSKE